jgi:hypothetical protein
MYAVENRVLKQSVKRNIDRFPKDFMFPLTKSEWQELITNCDKLPQNVKYSPAMPFAFTEQGVAMLSSVLKKQKNHTGKYCHHESICYGKAICCNQQGIS